MASGNSFAALAYSDYDDEVPNQASKKPQAVAFGMPLPKKQAVAGGTPLVSAAENKAKGKDRKPAVSERGAAAKAPPSRGRGGGHTANARVAVPKVRSGSYLF